MTRLKLIRRGGERPQGQGPLIARGDQQVERATTHYDPSLFDGHPQLRARHDGQFVTRRPRYMHMRAYAPGAWKWKGPYFQSHFFQFRRRGDRTAARTPAVLRRAGSAACAARRRTPMYGAQTTSPSALTQRGTTNCARRPVPARSLPHHSSAGTTTTTSPLTTSGVFVLAESEPRLAESEPRLAEGATGAQRVEVR